MQERDQGAAAGRPTAARQQARVPVEAQKAYYDKDVGKWVMLAVRRDRRGDSGSTQERGPRLRCQQVTIRQAARWSSSPRLMAWVGVGAHGMCVVELKSYHKPVLDWK